MSLFELDFIRRALVAGIVVGAAAPAIGAFVVQKRLALIGDGIGHVAFAGVAVALYAGWSPIALALVFAVAGAIGIDRLRARGPNEADMALALFFYGSIAAAVVVASLGARMDVTLFGALFGQVLTVTTAELVTIAALGGGVLVAVAALYRGLVATAVDEEAAIVAGVPVAALNTALMVLTAATIGVGMRVVGILLVAALMVLPVGVARNLASSFRGSLVAASLVGAASAAGGIVISYYADVAPSGMIVLVAGAALIVADRLRAVRGALALRRGASSARGEA